MPRMPPRRGPGLFHSHYDTMGQKKAQVKPCEFEAQFLTVRKEGAYGEAVGMMKKTKQTTKKISKTEYVDLSTGEVKEYNMRGTKGGESLRKTMKRLESLIRTNFSGGDKAQVFLTLTYSENMQDPEKLYEDFKNFWKRLTYKVKPRKLEYISVAEPQGRGAWHIHALVKAADGAALYLDNKWLAEVWGHGMTDCQRLKGDDAGAYYATYFTTIQSAEDDIGERGNRSKKQTKTDRLKLYPVNFKFYRHSRGIKEPEKAVMHREQYEAKYPVLMNTHSYAIIDDEENVMNLVQTELRRAENATRPDCGSTSEEVSASEKKGR